jgi:hypothetical protein
MIFGATGTEFELILAVNSFAFDVNMSKDSFE